MCAEYKNHYRNSDNFLSADCLPVDCDNDHSEDPKDWITPADVLEAFPGVSLAIHYSRFNQRKKNGKLARPKSPTKELMKLVLEGKLAHGGHPVLRWMMDNIFIRSDPAGNIKADKEKSTEKIDGAIATIMGLDRAIRCGNDSGASVYDSRGLLFI